MPIPEVIDFKTAREFLEALRPSNPRWLNDGQWGNKWIFRGCSKAEHDLVPSAWRPKLKDDALWKSFTRGRRERLETLDRRLNSEAQLRYNERAIALAEQVNFEKSIAGSFAFLLDRIGHRVPGEYTGPHSGSIDPYAFLGGDSTFNKIHPVFALAQHHGIPTRLLDWTYSPLVAAFFAADSKEKSVEGSMAVWALDPFHNIELHEGSEVRLFSVPRFDVGFLHAQHGLFTYLRDANHYYMQNGDWPKLTDNVTAGSLFKLTVPRVQANELMRLLWTEGISRAHLMPTPDNVCVALRQIYEGLLASSGANIEPK